MFYESVVNVFGYKTGSVFVLSAYRLIENSRFSPIARIPAYVQVSSMHTGCAVINDIRSEVTVDY